jgi:3-oxoacyl-[acyl-carrier protein] reductase
MADNLVLITGASSDIGIALIRRLMTSPDQPLILAHSFRGGDRLQDLQSDLGGRVILLQADFSESESVSALAEEVTEQYGTPRALVHLPALRLSYERFTKFKWERMEQDLAVQIRSAVLLLQRWLPKMSKAPNARVVFVLSSVVHGMPPKFLSMYTMVKYAQLGLMRSLAAEYSGTTLRVNAISPSMVDTQFISDIPPLAIQATASASPLGRNAKPEDLLGALTLLLSPDSEYLNGIDIPIAGGTVC